MLRSLFRISDQAFRQKKVLLCLNSVSSINSFSTSASHEVINNNSDEILFINTTETHCLSVISKMQQFESQSSYSHGDFYFDSISSKSQDLSLSIWNSRLEILTKRHDLSAAFQCFQLMFNSENWHFAPNKRSYLLILSYLAKQSKQTLLRHLEDVKFIRNKLDDLHRNDNKRSLLHDNEIVACLIRIYGQQNRSALAVNLFNKFKLYCVQHPTAAIINPFSQYLRSNVLLSYLSCFSDCDEIEPPATSKPTLIYQKFKELLMEVKENPDLMVFLIDHYIGLMRLHLMREGASQLLHQLIQVNRLHYQALNPNTIVAASVTSSSNKNKSADNTQNNETDNTVSKELATHLQHPIIPVLYTLPQTHLEFIWNSLFTLYVQWSQPHKIAQCLQQIKYTRMELSKENKHLYKEFQRNLPVKIVVKKSSSNTNQQQSLVSNPKFHSNQTSTQAQQQSKSTAQTKLQQQPHTSSTNSNISSSQKKNISNSEHVESKPKAKSQRSTI